MSDPPEVGGVPSNATRSDEKRPPGRPRKKVRVVVRAKSKKAPKLRNWTSGRESPEEDRTEYFATVDTRANIGSEKEGWKCLRITNILVLLPFFRWTRNLLATPTKGDVNTGNSLNAEAMVR